MSIIVAGRSYRVNETGVIYSFIPELWQLYNDTLEIHLAKPVDGNYQVYYDPVENTAFCNWDRLVGVESLTPAQAPEESR